MSVFSDVQELYNAGHSGWEKTRPHILAHALVGIATIGFLHVSLPEIGPVHIAASDITGNDWFKLAKDTGIIYVALLLPLVLFSAYVGIIELLGRLGITLMTALFGASFSQKAWQRFPSGDLAIVALTFQDDQFTMADLANKITALSIKLQSSKSDLASGYKNAIDKLNGSAAKYVGDFLAFLIFWNALFLGFPNTDWASSNVGHFWSVNLFLAILLWLAWRRLTGAIVFVPQLQLSAIATMLRFDPEYASLNDVPKERREKIEHRVYELTRERDRDAAQRASMTKLLLLKLGFRISPRSPSDLPTPWLPFPKLYRTGADLWFGLEAAHQAKDLPARSLLAIAYFRFCRGLWLKLQMLGHMLRYIVLGMI